VHGETEIWVGCAQDIIDEEKGYAGGNIQDIQRYKDIRI
jgi:hypothetical protein